MFNFFSQAARRQQGRRSAPMDQTGRLCVQPRRFRRIERPIGAMSERIAATARIGADPVAATGSASNRF
jgi:hypothetical protein